MAAVRPGNHFLSEQDRPDGYVEAALSRLLGHLTSFIRQGTGRTLLDWLTERRLTEARCFRCETDLLLS